MEKEFIFMENDVVFKYVMTSEKVIRGFLAAVLEVDPTSITELGYYDIDGIHAEGGIFAVDISIDGGEHIGILLQVQSCLEGISRSINLTWKMALHQPFVQISVFGFESSEEDKLHSKLKFVNYETRDVVFNKSGVHLISLSQLEQIEDDDHDELYYWAKLLTSKNRDEYYEIAKRNEYLFEAIVMTDLFNQNDERREDAIKHGKGIMDRATDVE